MGDSCRGIKGDTGSLDYSSLGFEVSRGKGLRFRSFGQGLLFRANSFVERAGNG